MVVTPSNWSSGYISIHNNMMDNDLFDISTLYPSNEGNIIKLFLLQLASFSSLSLLQMTMLTQHEIVMTPLLVSIITISVTRVPGLWV
jgi:hypothetical protein